MGKFTIINDDDTETTLPTKWVICSTCEGRGKHSRSMGALSEEDMADEDFRSDYMAGHYDRRCDDCEGTGKVEVVNTKALSAKERNLWMGMERDRIDCEAENRAERQAEHYFECRLLGVQPDWDC